MHLDIEILFGVEALNNLVSLSEIDMVVCAISGSAGLESSLNAVKQEENFVSKQRIFSYVWQTFLWI